MGMCFYYFTSTHWDREWYQPFQGFRKHLCDTAERLLDHFDRTPGFDKFTFDGQTIVLNDIAELRPSLRARLAKYVAEGKLKVGPWYVMPDEFLVSPEALVRNLLIGREVAREFGAEPWPVGYICDIFGHIAQLPQIMADFGLKGAVAWRGFPPDRGPRLFWRGADGTVIPVIRLLPRNGYGNFTFDVRGWWDVGVDETTFKTRFRQWVENTRKHFGDTFILSDAQDHNQPAGELADILRWIRECYPEAELVCHTDYTDFFDREFPAGADLPTVAGEQIAPADIQATNEGYQISATLSSRYDVKLANDAAQNRLELAIEPECAIRAAAGAFPTDEPLRYLWRHLVQNHAHDSICGCSIDAVHRQVLVRLEEVRQLADCLEEDFVRQDRERLTGHDIRRDIHAFLGDEKALRQAEIAPDGVYRLRIFRTLPGTAHDARVMTVAFPSEAEYPAYQAEPFGYERLHSFRLYGEDGAELPYSIVKVEHNAFLPFYRHDCRFYDLYTVAFRPTLRGASWNTVEIRPSATPVRHRATQLDGRMSAANGLIRLDVASDGTFDVTDLRSGRRYARQNAYRFDRDLGDGWNHVSPAGSPVTLGSSSATIRLVHDGPCRTEFEIVRRYEFPRELEFRGNLYERYAGVTESKEIVTVELHTFVALNAGSDVLEIRTELDNPARDYRLRLAVPTGMTGKYFVSQSGAFLEREPGREHGALTDGWFESERVGKNFDGILGKRDDAGGLALLAKAGLHEAGGIPGSEGELFVTLLRAFRRTVDTNGETEGQLNKRLVWEYALKCFPSADGEAELRAALAELRTAPVTHQLGAHLVKNAPDDASFLELDGNLSFSCLKPAADGEPKTVILRLLNPADETRTGQVRFAAPFRSVRLARLDETETGTLAENADKFEVSASPRRWVTLKIRF